MTYLELIQYFKYLGRVKLELMNDDGRVFSKFQNLKVTIKSYESLYEANPYGKTPPKVLISAKNNMIQMKNRIEDGKAIITKIN